MDTVWIIYLLFITNSRGQSCPVAEPTIISQLIYHVSPPPLHGPSWSVSYTCNDPGSIVIWSGSAIMGDFTVLRWSSNTSPTLKINGITVTEVHTTDPTCINSTLTFSGQNLNALDGGLLVCRDNSNKFETAVAIRIPRLPSAIDLADIELKHSRCTANNESVGVIFLEWTQPNDTGGENVNIEHYIVNVTGSENFVCPPNQCNVTTTNTTITGLLCNTSYIVTVRAVNFLGEGNSSNPIIINAGLSHIILVSSTLRIPNPFTYSYTLETSSSLHVQVPLVTASVSPRPKPNDALPPTQSNGQGSGVTIIAVGVSVGVAVPITIITTIIIIIGYLSCVNSCKCCLSKRDSNTKELKEFVSVGENMAYGQVLIQNTILNQKCENASAAVPSVMTTDELTATDAAPVYEELI